MKYNENYVNFYKVLSIIMIAIVVGWTYKMTAAPGIANSLHNFSTKSWNTGGQICQPCHTPHNASATIKPLWNHATTSTNYTLYSNYSLNATLGQPTGSSKICLSCHDGTVALDNFGGKTDGTNYLTGSTLLDNDLSNDHPISFTYDAALVTSDGGLNAHNSAGVAALLKGGKVECSSCHDVHNAAGYPKLLVKSNAASALCLTCHNK